MNCTLLSKARNSIIKAGQEMYRSGLVTGTWGNISSRIVGSDTFVITPSGKNYLEIGPEDLVVMDLTGNIVEGDLKPSSEFQLHRLIYLARPEINAVVHTHSIYGTAHSVAREIVPACVEDLAMIVGGDVLVAPYAAAGTEELAHNAIKTMGERWAVLLANHGVVGLGRSVEEAMVVCQVVEKTAQINIAARTFGNVFRLEEQEMAALRDTYIKDYARGK